MPLDLKTEPGISLLRCRRSSAKPTEHASMLRYYHTALDLAVVCMQLYMPIGSQMHLYVGYNQLWVAKMLEVMNEYEQVCA